VLDLAKIEAGKLELQVEDFDLTAVVREAAATAQPLADRNGNAITVRASSGAIAMRADSMRVRQIILNLLSNACKFTRNGEIKVELAREECDGGGGDGRDRVSIAIADSGIGMTPEQLGRLFQDFTQADRSTARTYGGTGLGLAISRRLCDLMGGTIDVASAPGTGTTFTVRLPAPAEAPERRRIAQETAAAVSAGAAPRTGAAAPTVLVVDDDETVRDLMRHFLAREGFEVVTARDGEEGLRLARERRPALITLDVLMPGLDGWSVLQQLKADAELADTPVLMMTIVDERDRGLALGASDYLTKPINRGRLRAILARHRPPERERPSVLIVEDDADTRRHLRRALAGEGWEVSEAENGRVALDRLRQARPDLVLLDLMMPEMDGFEFLAELRWTPTLRPVPIVVLTAMELNEEDHRRLNGGVLHVLQKAARGRDELLGELRDLIRRYTASLGAEGEVGPHRA
jgi:CheY-like chemotaxis protein/two-component sensor histidine kinase